MTRDEIRQIIWQEIGRALNIVLTGNSQDADGQREKIQSMLTQAGTTDSFPVAYPWGMASRVPDSTAQLVLQMGNSPMARVIATHFDPDRPKLGTGETVLYNEFGQRIYLKNGKVLLGSEKADQPAVLGTVFQTMMSTVLNAIATHTHTGNVGYPTGPPLNAAAFITENASPIQDGAILSDETFVEKSNAT